MFIHNKNIECTGPHVHPLLKLKGEYVYLKPFNNRLKSAQSLYKADWSLEQNNSLDFSVVEYGNM